MPISSGMMRHMMRVISASPHSRFRFMVSPFDRRFYRPCWSFLSGGALVDRVLRWQVQECRSIFADKFSNGGVRHLKIEQHLRDASETIHGTLRTHQTQIGRKNGVVNTGDINEMSQIVSAELLR